MSKGISKEQAKIQLWKSGNLSWKLDKNQLQMRDFILRDHVSNTVVIGASRRLGKSYAMLVISLEICLKKPKTKVNYVAPTASMLRDFIFPMAEEILEDCPEGLKPEISTAKNSIKFKNGSEIKLAGTDNKRADKLRGRASDLCIVDEAGFCTDLGYVVDSILQPTTLTTKGKIVLISTPPATLDHDFIKYMRKSQFDGTFIKKTIYDNPRLTETDISRMADSVGGVDSNQFRREYLCETVVSIDDVVIPEFTTEVQDKTIIEVDKPPFYDGYVAMDPGGKDFTGIVFAYYDFANARVVILDELLLKDVTIDEIAKQIQIKEEQCFVDNGFKKEPYLRVTDNNNIILINELNVNYGYNFIPTDKNYKDAALNQLRLLIKSERLVIHPRCVNLISHIQNATWNTSGKDFSRSPTMGHYDLLAATMYLVRNILFTKNPYPNNGYNPFTHVQASKQITEAPKLSKDRSVSLEDGLRSVFKINKGKRFFR